MLAVDQVHETGDHPLMIAHQREHDAVNLGVPLRGLSNGGVVGEAVSTAFW